jgi:2-iminobutanoate/2-iminopropanoate deaminase
LYNRFMTIRHVNVPGLAGLPQFSHATIAGTQVFVAGVIGAAPGGDGPVAGGAGPESRQILVNMLQVLDACGCTMADVAMVHVYLTDMDDFPAMNEVYAEVVGGEPPGRITVGCTALALDAKVEMDCVAFLPDA